VFTLAALVSWGAGALVDWAQGKIEGPQAAAQTPSNFSRLPKDAGKTKP